MEKIKATVNITNLNSKHSGSSERIWGTMFPVASLILHNLPAVFERKWVGGNQVNCKEIGLVLSNLGPEMHNLVPGLQGRAVKSSSKNGAVDS